MHVAMFVLRLVLGQLGAQTPRGALHEMKGRAATLAALYKWVFGPLCRYRTTLLTGQITTLLPCLWV